MIFFDRPKKALIIIIGIRIGKDRKKVLIKRTFLLNVISLVPIPVGKVILAVLLPSMAILANGTSTEYLIECNNCITTLETFLNDNFLFEPAK